MPEGKLPKGELGPEPMRFYAEPVMARLIYVKITKDPSPHHRKRRSGLTYPGSTKWPLCHCA